MNRPHDWIVESLDHLDDGALAGAGGTDDGGGGASFDLESDSLEGVGLAFGRRGITESHICELDTVF